MQCQRRDCERQADHAVKICVPALGSIEGAPPAAGALIGVLLCEDHVDECEAQPFIEAAGDALRVPVGIANLGGDPLDWGRAYVVGVPMNSAEFLDWQLHAAGGVAH